MAKKSFDVTINATLEIDEEEWDALRRTYVDEESALYELASDIECSNLDSVYGDAWVCSAEVEEM